MENQNQNPEGTQPEPKPMRAAQYVRMSTEHQQYSTENQSDVIARIFSQTRWRNGPHLR